jgi:hypothetical protein
MLKDDVAHRQEKGLNPLSTLDLETRALEMLSPTRPPERELLSNLLNAVAHLPESVVKEMVQLDHGVPGWFFARALSPFLRLSCKLLITLGEYDCFGSPGSFHACPPGMTAGQQLVALDGLVVPRLPTVRGADGSGHARLAPILVTKDDYFDRVLSKAGFQTLEEMKFLDFCASPFYSIPVRQCFLLAV